MEENIQKSNKAAANEGKKEIHHHYYRRRECCFNAGGFFLGFLLIFIGLLFLGQNLGWFKINLNLSWHIIWPTLLVFIGLSMLNFRTWLGAFLGIIISVIVLVLIILMIAGDRNWEILNNLFNTIPDIFR